MRIKELPKVLAIQLKRFTYVERLQRLTKLSHRVVFPFELRLFDTVQWPSPQLLLRVPRFVFYVDCGLAGSGVLLLCLH